VKPNAVGVVTEQLQGIGQPHQMPRHFQLQVGFQQMSALVPAVIGPQTILLHGQQLGLNPVAQHEFLVARKLVQLRDQIDQQVLQLRQDVVAFGHAIFLNKIPPLRGLAKGLKHKRAKTKAPSHNGTQCISC
jgi:hypothetical protein